MLFSDQELLERTFDLKAKVDRFGSYEDEYGETKQGLNTVYESVLCAVEQATSRNITFTPSKSNIEFDTKMICSPSYVINAGDTITVTFVNNQEKKFTSGEPYYFSSHTEVPLIREGEA